MERVQAQEAQFPLPFPQRLEYNAPVHGTWNIVHTSMLVPEAHSIYVCSDNCMRGVVMTAAEMGCQDRFSCVTLSEMDVMTDNLETITIEGASNVIDHLEKRPPVIFLFLVCLHIFVSSDEEYILKKLRERYPDICFVRCYMDCVRQKTGPTPDMKLRGFLFDPIQVRQKVPGRVNVLGGDLPFREGCELMELLHKSGCSVLQLQDCRTYGEYQRLGEAQMNVCTYMNAQDGVRHLSERMGCGYLYLPPAVDYEEIRKEYRALAEAVPVSDCLPDSPSDLLPDSPSDLLPDSLSDCLPDPLFRTGSSLKSEGMPNPAADGVPQGKRPQRCGEQAGCDMQSVQSEAWFAQQEALCEEALSHLRLRLGDIPVAIDYTCHQRPLGIAKLFLTHGIQVKRVYLDGVLEEEKDVLEWLREHAPRLELTATMRPQSIRREETDPSLCSVQGGKEADSSLCTGLRVKETDPSSCIGPGVKERMVLALGQKAAWFEQTGYFVNMIESGGLWGYEGIRELCRLSEEALETRKDMRDIVPRKGMGWPSLCDVPARLR